MIIMLPQVYVLPVVKMKELPTPELKKNEKDRFPLPRD